MSRFSDLCSCPALKKSALAKTLQMDCVTFLLLSIFVEHGHLQRLWAGSERSSCLRYYDCYFLSLLPRNNPDLFILDMHFYSPQQYQFNRWWWIFCSGWHASVWSLVHFLPTESLSKHMFVWKRSKEPTFLFICRGAYRLGLFTTNYGKKGFVPYSVIDVVGLLMYMERPLFYLVHMERHFFVSSPISFISIVLVLLNISTFNDGIKYLYFFPSSNTRISWES